MDYEDRITISTAEGVDLELALAGVGSRFTSAIIDYLIQLALLLALAVLLLWAGPLAGLVGGAAFAIASFLVFVGYDVAFEVLASGRTPGKRLNGLRVVRDDGGPIGFLSSAIRNALRLVDIMPPPTYLVGIGAVLVSGRNKRVGDIVAGTLVVRERRGRERPLEAAAGARVDDPLAPWRSWDVSGVTADEAAAVRAFLARRSQLTGDARSLLADELAAALRPKVPGVGPNVGSETFLEQLAAAKSARG